MPENVRFTRLYRDGLLSYSTFDGVDWSNYTLLPRALNDPSGNIVIPASDGVRLKIEYAESKLVDRFNFSLLSKTSGLTFVSRYGATEPDTALATTPQIIHDAEERRVNEIIRVTPTNAQVFEVEISGLAGEALQFKKFFAGGLGVQPARNFESKYEFLDAPMLDVEVNLNTAHVVEKSNLRTQSISFSFQTKQDQDKFTKFLRHHTVGGLCLFEEDSSLTSNCYIAVVQRTENSGVFVERFAAQYNITEKWS